MFGVQSDAGFQPAVYEITVGCVRTMAVSQKKVKLFTGSTIDLRISIPNTLDIAVKLEANVYQVFICCVYIIVIIM